MLNVGGGELLVILLIALIVLGPNKLPGVAKQVGGIMREVRRVSTGFQQELKSAMDEPVEEAARERGDRIVSSEEQPAPASDTSSPDSEGEAMSSAAAAGMYDVSATDADDQPGAQNDPGPTDADSEQYPPEPAHASEAEAAGMYDPAPELVDEGAGDDSAGSEADE
ncbi:MAG: Sec-independent protein translocase protein TatB [Acidimicrobiales bacterium]